MDSYGYGYANPACGTRFILQRVLSFVMKWVKYQIKSQKTKSHFNNNNRAFDLCSGDERQLPASDSHF